MNDVEASIDLWKTVVGSEHLRRLPGRDWSELVCISPANDQPTPLFLHLF